MSEDTKLERFFLYYVPGVPHVGENDLQDLGLLHLYGCEIECRGCQGPDGGNGMTFVATEPGVNRGELAHRPDRQTWKKCDGGKFWIGWFNEKMPGEADLRSGLRAYESLTLPLGDGARWRLTPSEALPMGFGLGDDGQQENIKQPKYAEQYAAHEWLFDWICSDDEARDFSEIVKRIALALSLNYRIGYWEALVLGLFSQENINMVTYGMLDISERAEIDSRILGEKKTTETDSEESDSSGG